MPLTPDWYADLLTRLGAARPVTAKKMFGGAGLYLDGVMFGIADDDRLYFKVDDQTKVRYESEGMGGWIPHGAQSYREVPSRLLSEPEELGEWMDEAVEVSRAKAKTRRKR
jgi:DNA transformation protein